MTTTKTYSSLSNAKRAAKAAGLNCNTLEFYYVDGKCIWAPKDSPEASEYTGKPVTAPAAKRAADCPAPAPAPQPAPEPQPVPQPDPTPAPVGEPPAAALPEYKQFQLYGKSSVLRPVALVHAFLDERGGELTRKEALFALAQAGVNNCTARTQYQVWRGRQRRA